MSPQRCVQLNAICRTATEPRPVEDLMQACDLHPQEEEMTLDLLRALTEVNLNSSEVASYVSQTLFSALEDSWTCLRTSRRFIYLALPSLVVRT